MIKPVITAGLFSIHRLVDFYIQLKCCVIEVWWCSIHDGESYFIGSLVTCWIAFPSDPTPENELSQSLVASAKARVSDSMSVVGRRLVSEREWQALQDEVKYWCDYVFCLEFAPLLLCHCESNRLKLMK